MVRTTSGAVCGGYKKMLERKKLYTEPAGKKEWSDGGQKWRPFTSIRHKTPDTPDTFLASQ